MSGGCVAWIRVIEEDDADGALAALYRSLIDPESGSVDNILKIHSLNLDGLRAHHRRHVFRRGQANNPWGIA